MPAGMPMMGGMNRPQIETDKMLDALGLAERVLNLQPTPEGSLRSISGPAQLVDENDIVIHGIGHTVVNGQEIMVRQTEDRLQVFEGFSGTKWRDITSPDGASGTYTVDLTVNNAPKYPPVFIPTPGGLIIIPKGPTPRALFFDGLTVEPLGFVETPSAPELAISQEQTVAALGGAGPLADAGNRVGVVVTIQGSTTLNSRRERGEYEGAVQWISRRGDLSPVSSRSGKVEIQQAVVNAANDSESALFRILWRGIDPGPPHTLGRICARTRSLVTGGTAQLFELPQHAQPSSFVLATIPDNVTQVYSDNVSEGALSTPMRDVAPIPIGRVACIAMGRLWIATQDGALWYSLPGRWGTFLRSAFVYPDVNGAEITGLIAAPGGLIATTMTSTHFITPNDDGSDFRSAALSSRFGCIAPATMDSLPDGTVIWLGRDGFVGFRDGRIGKLPEEHPRLMRQINMGRIVQSVARTIDGVYHCWLPHVASRIPNLCLTFDGTGWRRRDDVAARHVCVTQDYRGYALIAGEDVLTSTAGVLVLDRESPNLGPRVHTSVLETAWLPTRGVNLASLRRLVLWGRETGLGTVSVEIMRDWREKEVIDTVLIDLNAPEDPPETWDSAVLGSEQWDRRRPFFGVVDLDVPSAQALKFRFTATTSFDFIGFELRTQDSVTDGSWA